MIEGVGKLFEAITGPEWRMENEETGELVKYNFDKTRQLFYVGSDVKWGSSSFADMGLRFLNEDGGWDEVISIKHTCRLDEEKVEIAVRARWKNEKIESLYWYSGGGRRSVYGFAGGGLTSDPRVLENRQELLPGEGEMPEKIDLVLTANLFVDQMIRGEMERPVLVPERSATAGE